MTLWVILPTLLALSLEVSRTGYTYQRVLETVASARPAVQTVVILEGGTNRGLSKGDFGPTWYLDYDWLDQNCDSAVATTARLVLVSLPYLLVGTGLAFLAMLRLRRKIF